MGRFGSRAGKLSGRYAAEMAPELPRYTHVPGATPHPIRDPAGHAYGQAIPPCPAPTAEDWTPCWPLERGRVLFESGYYWEAHETWELAWVAAGRQGAVAGLIKGLIKLAAAGVKLYEGQPVGVERHARRAADLFDIARKELGDTALGYSLPALIQVAKDAAIKPPERPVLSPGTPSPLLSLAKAHT